jgi:hypothetical protein
MFNRARFRPRFRGGSSAAPSLALNFLSGALDPRITFTRASNAWFFDGAGNLVQASTNEPRFDYDPTTLQARGLLIEGVRTNGVRNPRLEGAVAGTPGTMPTNTLMSTPGMTGISIQVVGVGSENGFSYVDLRWFGIASAAGTLAFWMEQGFQIAATVGQTFAYSLYAKVVAGAYPAASSTFGILEQDGAGTTLGLPILTASGIPGSVSTPLRQCRMTAVGTVVAAGTAFILPTWRSGSVTSGATIDVTIRFAAPQTELGTFPTSPIFPAVGSPAASTRASDIVSVATLTPWFNPNEGTILVEYQRPFVGFNQFEVDFSNGTFDEFIGLYTDPASQIAQIRQGATSQAVIVLEAGAGVNDRLNKKILAYQVNNFAASLNGAAPIVDTSGSVPIGLTTMRIGAFLGGSQFCNGWISRIAYYPTRLSNATLQALTA